MAGAHGNAIAIIKKLATLHAKNGIALAIIVGDLFGSTPSEIESSDGEVYELLKGKIDIPLPVYFSLGHQTLPLLVSEHLQAHGGELCPNLFYLGRRSTITTSEGIKIATLGGTLQGPSEGNESVLNDYTPQYSDEDVNILCATRDVDILVTSDWPAGVINGSNVKYSSSDMPTGQPKISELCSSIKPRYHICSSSFYYEREPFSHNHVEDSNGTYHITRFINLATFESVTKEKWIYAFGLDPKAARPITLPAGVTTTPFSVNLTKRKALPSATDEYARFAPHNSQDGGRGRGRRNKRARRAPTVQECFFCLSNAEVAAHLIASIGETAYMTVAKGPLSTNDSYTGLDFPAHVLIIPLEHSPTLSTIQDKDARVNTRKEMYRYQKALQDMVYAQSSKNDGKGLGAVTWEISRGNGVHVHWQFMPVPQDVISKGLVEAAFKVQAQNNDYQTCVVKDVSMTALLTGSDDTDATQGDHFRATIWPGGDDEHMRELVLPFDTTEKFDLQFGRRVIAQLLGMEARIDWRDCGQTEAKETKDVEVFKKLFEAHDFTSP